MPNAFSSKLDFVVEPRRSHTDHASMFDSKHKQTYKYMESCLSGLGYYHLAIALQLA